jgi:hypothetical protein
MRSALLALEIGDRSAFFGSQRVSHAAHGVQQARAVLLEFAAHRAHVHLHQIRVVILVTPYRGEDLGLGDHLVAVCGEVGQQLELGRGQCDGLLAALHDSRIQVDHQVRDRDLGL